MKEAGGGGNMTTVHLASMDLSQIKEKMGEGEERDSVEYILHPELQFQVLRLSLNINFPRNGSFYFL